MNKHIPPIIYSQQNVKTDEEGPPLEHLTDLGNARRLVTRHGHDFRYCHAWRRWLAWDGRRWAVDTTGELVRRAKETVRAIYAEAAYIADEEIRLDVVRWAIKSESRANLFAMQDLAKSELGIPVAPEELDADPWLLNVANGTLDLRSGELRPHRQQDLITKLVPVGYEPQAMCPTWLTFLDRILDQKESLIDFLQRAFGYALTGDTTEQVLFFCHGPGANGKSTLLETLRTLLGSDYAQHTPTSTLLVKSGGGAIPNDLARLKGARFVTAIEAESGRKLAETLVKQLTGGDHVTARFLRQEFFEFKPTFKLFLAANHKPAISGTDYAIWRRIRLIPFQVTIPPAEQDKHLLQKLKQEWPGILAWGVRGCLAWQAQGLGTPDEVQQATEAYREEMDVLGTYFRERCQVLPHAQVTSQELYTDYQVWCGHNGEHPMSKRSFGLWLQEQSFKPVRIGEGGTRGWRGLRLQPTTDTSDATDTNIS